MNNKIVKFLKSNDEIIKLLKINSDGDDLLIMLKDSKSESKSLRICTVGNRLMVYQIKKLKKGKQFIDINRINQHKEFKRYYEWLKE